MGRMQGVSIRGSIVWDPRTTYERKRDSPFWPPINSDALPRFADLTNDDDRELKAIGKKPGTYNVVCNPDSFTNPRTEAGDEDEVGGNYVVSTTVNSQSVIKNENPGLYSPYFDFSQNLDEPEVVILKRFEEPCFSRRSSLQIYAHFQEKGDSSGENSDFGDTVPSQQAQVDGVDDPHELVTKDLEFYRKYIAPKLTKMHDASLLPRFNSPVDTLELDPFERESIQFPPLFHAIVALSALSSSRRFCTLDALHHYQQALPTLQTSLKDLADLSSNGTLYTHFLLLIYEILAVDHEQLRECMWQQHLSQLVRILFLRVEVFGKERLPYMVWSLIVIDTYASLTAGGDGELVSTLTENGLVPNPQHITEPLVSVEPPESLTLFQEVLGLAQKVVALAGKLGQLSHKLRDPAADVDMAVYGESECYQIVYQLKKVWQAEQPRVENIITAASTTGVSISGAPGSVLLPQVQETYEHACALYNATVIFGYTSVFPLQRASLTTDRMNEVQTAISSIVTQAASLCSDSSSQTLGPNHRYMLFPLFLAGIESTSPAEKIWIADILMEFSKKSLGSNTRVINCVLREIYASQEQGCGVDWIEFMDSKGWRVVIYDI
ncbi:fungal-specific transcription factor domain-containing protein [Trichophaea hybrida]|nr:fungal-specific transcription factor domain-containing protein [Trichophaea hybrida]